MCQKQVKTNMAAVNKKLKFVILQQVNIIALLLLQILAAIKNYQYSRIRTLHMNCAILVRFYKIHRFVIGPFETCLWSRHLYLFKNKHGLHSCTVSNFHPGLEKMLIIWKMWNFHPGLKLHLGLAKLSCWNFYM